MVGCLAATKPQPRGPFSLKNKKYKKNTQKMRLFDFRFFLFLALVGVLGGRDLENLVPVDAGS